MLLQRVLWNAAHTEILATETSKATIWFANQYSAREFFVTGYLLNMMVTGMFDCAFQTPNGEGGYEIVLEYVSTSI
jgi:hypothetical protein